MLLQITEPGAQPTASQTVTSADAIGIDFGTTNSVVMLGDTALVPPTPTALHLGGIEVRSIKRLLGQSTVEAKALCPTLAVVDDGNGLPAVAIGDHLYTPVELTALYLRNLKSQAEKTHGAPITQVVLTVPAYFDDTQRSMVKTAAILAGLQPMRLISEPTAAALAYGLDRQTRGTYAVYDLGGGTFDCSILRLTEGVFQVIAVGGDTRLGGDDIDIVLAHQFFPALDLTQAKALAEQAKIHLTNAATWTHDSAHITRQDLDAIAAPFIQKTIAICQQVISRTKLDGIILVGGATRMPLAHQMLAQAFDVPILHDLDPDTIVACGAAHQANTLLTGNGSLLLDVTPLSLGLETMGGIVEKLIPRNTPIPFQTTQDFTTYADGQMGLKLHIVQGEREFAHDCRSLAEFTLTGIPPMPAGHARISVTFSVDADNLLTVTAQEATTQTMASITVQPSFNLSPDLIAEILKDGYTHAQDDLQARLAIDLKTIRT